MCVCVCVCVCAPVCVCECVYICVYTTVEPLIMDTQNSGQSMYVERTHTVAAIDIASVHF